MSLILDQLAKVFDVSKEETTNLTADIVAGGTILAVDNTDGFADNDYAILERIGDENAEIVKITTVDSVTQLTVGAVKFAHRKLTPTYRTPFNQVKIYRSDTEDGVYAEITGSPFDMEVDQPYTYAVDPTGSLTKYYKYSYYNETSTNESDKSEAFLGGKPDQLCTLEEVKEDLGADIEKKNIDKKLLDLIRRVTDEIINYTKVQFISKTITNEYHDIGSEENKVFPKYYPVFGTPTLVEDDGDALDYDADPDDTEYHVYPGYIVKDSGYFTAGRKKVKLSYVAWHGSIPPEIKNVAIEMVAIRSGHKIRTFTDGEGITHAVALRSIPKDLWDVLDRYKRKEI